MTNSKLTPYQALKQTVKLLEKRIDMLEKLYLTKFSTSEPTEDELMGNVCNYLLSSEFCSCSNIQRKFAIGYNRAAQIVEYLIKHNLISSTDGTKPRKVHTVQIKRYLKHLNK